MFSHQSLPPLEGPSTVSWLIVMACTVVMRPSTMPKLSFSTCKKNAKRNFEIPPKNGLRS